MKKSYLLIISILFLSVFSSLIMMPGVSRAAAKEINVPFFTVFENKVMEWKFPYDDKFFSEKSDVFSSDLAKASFGLAVSAFRNDEFPLENQYESYFKEAGFTDIFAFGYDEPTSKDSLSGVIAHRKTGDFTLIAAVPCGQGYKKEWAGNLEVGDELRHVGFSNAAAIMEKHISEYIQKYHLEGKLKLWMSGFSRAAAVSNITAADMIKSGLFEDVYAYLFAVPRTTKEADAAEYTGIYNICGKNDPVTQIPMQSWGFERYGKDMYTPSMEADSSYYLRLSYADDVSLKLMDELMWYNPEVSYQIHLIIEFLAELFPTNAEYAEKFQDTLMGYWDEANPDAIVQILSGALLQLEDLDRRQEYSTEVLLDYLEYISSVHLKESSNQVERGFWNPKQPMAENVIREHMPYTYLNWIFSDNDIDYLYYGPDVSRRVYFYGNADVEVYRNDKMLIGLKHNGKYIYPDINETGDENIYRNVFLIRNGNETLTCLPVDGDYHLKLHVDKPENIIFYDVLSTPENTFGDLDTFYYLDTEPGDFILEFTENQENFSVNAVDEAKYELVEIPYEYSPTMIMSGESNAEKHITIAGLLQLIFDVLLFLAVLLFICLIICIIHAIMKRKKGRVYSPWYVIVPHLIVIVLFTLLTQFFTVNMFSIGMSRRICAGIAMLTILLLAVRGLIRRRNLKNIIITSGILILMIINVIIYQTSGFVSSSLLHFIIYCLCMAAISLAAVFTFFTNGKKKNQV